jgi:hypothetical protein
MGNSKKKNWEKCQQLHQTRLILVEFNEGVNEKE